MSSWVIALEGDKTTFVNDLAIDSAGNVLVVGEFYGDLTCGKNTLKDADSSMYFNLYVAKLSPSGKCLWAVQAGGKYYDSAFSVAVDGSDNVFIAGTFDDSATFGKTTLSYGSSYHDNLYVARLSPTGSFIWAQKIAATGGSRGSGLAVDAGGAIYVTGQFSGALTGPSGPVFSGGSSDVLVAKLDGSGKLTWVRTAGGTGWDGGQGMALDGAGGILVSGGFDGAATFGTKKLTAGGVSDAFLARLTTDGNLSWVVAGGGTANKSLNYHDSALDVAVGAKGIVMTGHVIGGAVFGAHTLSVKSARAAYVASLDSAGKFTGASLIGGQDPSGISIGNAVAYDAAGNVYVAGDYGGKLACGSVTFNAAVTVMMFMRLDAKGACTWAVSGDAASAASYGRAVTVDSKGNLYLAGMFRGKTLKLGAATLSASGANNIVVQKVGAGSI